MFLSRVPSSTTACTWPGAQAPEAPAISTGGAALGALASLRPELRVADAGARDQLHQLQRDLVGDQFVMGKLGLLFGGTHAPLRAAGVPAPHRLAPHDPALAHRVRVSA
jgi:hypothetical protein